MAIFGSHAGTTTTRTAENIIKAFVAKEPSITIIRKIQVHVSDLAAAFNLNLITSFKQDETTNKQEKTLQLCLSLRLPFGSHFDYFENAYLVHSFSFFLLRKTDYKVILHQPNSRSSPFYFKTATCCFNEDVAGFVNSSSDTHVLSLLVAEQQPNPKDLPPPSLTFFFAGGANNPHLVKLIFKNIKKFCN